MLIVPQTQWATKARHKNEDTVYLAASIPMYSTPAYDAAFTRIHQQYQHTQLLSARDLWHSNEHWLRTYCNVLADVTHAYILVPDTGLVGRGVYLEWHYLQLISARCTALLPGNEECDCLMFEIVNPFDWQRFARMCCLDGTHICCTRGSLEAAETTFPSSRKIGGACHG